LILHDNLHLYITSRKSRCCAFTLDRVVKPRIVFPIFVYAVVIVPSPPDYSYDSLVALLLEYHDKSYISKRTEAIETSSEFRRSIELVRSSQVKLACVCKIIYIYMYIRSSQSLHVHAPFITYVSVATAYFADDWHNVIRNSLHNSEELNIRNRILNRMNFIN